MRWVLFLFAVGTANAATVPREDSIARLRMARQIAREHNDKALVSKVDVVARQLPDDTSLDDSSVRSIEVAVGIDPGGWSMAGQPLFRPSPGMKEKLQAIRPRFESALAAGDPTLVRAAVAEMAEVYGTQAGVPDGRRAGRTTAIAPISEADAAKFVVNVLESEAASIRVLSQGKPLPHQMLRLYAGVLSGLADIRPAILKHHPDSLAALDQLAHGCASVLTGLQQPSGLFPFPDLRGHNIRFGEMIEKQAARGAVEVKDGWIVTADPDGGSQFDTGVCGVALLAAGKVYAREDWTKAGLLAADWALKQPCVGNFNYNAFSVSLLAQAFTATGERRYLDGALNKLRVGVAPGQAPNGRWLDPHNARTVYHVIILRALGDLGQVLSNQDKAEVDAVAKPSIKALLDEFDAMGITVDALPELLALRRLYPDNERLRQAIEHMASVIVAKSTDGKRFKLGASLDQLSAVARVWP